MVLVGSDFRNISHIQDIYTDLFSSSSVIIFHNNHQQRVNNIKIAQHCFTTKTINDWSVWYKVISNSLSLENLGMFQSEINTRHVWRYSVI